MKDQDNENKDIIPIIAHTYLFIKRYMIILLIFIVCGIILGFLKSNSNVFHYKKHLTLNSIVVHKEVSIDIVKSLQLLIANGNSDILAKKMNIPEQAAASIKSIDTSTFKNKFIDIGFGLDITFADVKYSDTISAGVLYLFNNNEYYKKNIDLFLKEKQSILDNINEKLKAGGITNSPNENNYLPVRSDNSMLVRTTSTDFVRLLEKKFEVERDIEFGKKITIVEDTQGKIPVGIGMKKSVFLYGLAFTILGIVLALIIESLRLSKTYFKKK